MIERYFEITEFKRGIPSKIVEYFGPDAKANFIQSTGKFALIWKGQKCIFKPNKKEQSVNSVMAEAALILITAKYMGEK